MSVDEKKKGTGRTSTFGPENLALIHPRRRYLSVSPTIRVATTVFVLIRDSVSTLPIITSVLADRDWQVQNELLPSPPRPFSREHPDHYTPSLYPR